MQDALPLAEISPQCSRMRRRNPDRATEFDVLLGEIAHTADSAAFSAIYEHHRPLLIRFFASRRPVDADPEDMAQQVLQTVWQKAHLFSPAKASATTWIYAIARNHHIDALRRCACAREALFDSEGCPDEQPSPEIQVDGETVHANLAMLPPSQAAVIHAVYFLDKTHRQAATELGMPLGTIKSCLRLALVKIKRAYSLADGC